MHQQHTGITFSVVVSLQVVCGDVIGGSNMCCCMFDLVQSSLVQVSLEMSDIPL